MKRCLQQSAQESAFEQGPIMKNCSNRLHSDQHGMKEEDENKGPIPKTDKNYGDTCTQTHKDIQ